MSRFKLCVFSVVLTAVFSLPFTSGLDKKTLFVVGGHAVQQFVGDKAFFFETELAVDADGAPNAYNSNDTGIDYLANAGHPGNWWGISVDSSGTPYVQTDSMPYPGYYVSTTSLEDSSYPSSNPSRFVDASKIPFIVLPLGSDVSSTGVRLGDLALVVSGSKRAYALYGDKGPKTHLGEGSVALSLALGHDPFNSKGKVVSGIDRGVWYVVFPGSGTGKPLSVADINTYGKRAFDAWGGEEKLKLVMN